MKKISFIIIGGAIALASCNNQPTVDTAKQQAHIDSVVNSFLDSKKADLQKMCDDNIMAAAQDSAKMIIEKEKKGVHHVAAKPVVKKVETKATDIKTGGLHGKADGTKDAGSVGSTGLHGKSDQSNVKTDNGNIGKGGLHSKADKK